MMGKRTKLKGVNVVYKQLERVCDCARVSLPTALGVLLKNHTLLTVEKSLIQ